MKIVIQLLGRTLELEYHEAYQVYNELNPLFGSSALNTTVFPFKEWLGDPPNTMKPSIGGIRSRPEGAIPMNT